MDLKYYGLCLATNIARFIPTRLGYFLSGYAGDVYYILSTKRRNNVINNIRRACPNIDSQTVQQKTRQVFRNAAKNYFDLTKMPYINMHKLDGKVNIEGMNNLTRAVASRKGVIITTAHLGNFEFSAHVIASGGNDMVVLVESYNSTPLLRKLVDLRQGNGVRVLPVDMYGIKEGYKTLCRGGIVTLVSDRDVTGHGIKIKFLGKETSFPAGAVDLALRTGATIVPIFSLRKNNDHTAIFVEPPLALFEAENRDQEIKTNLERLAAIIEKYIRTYPEQWVVLEPM